MVLSRTESVMITIVLTYDFHSVLECYTLNIYIGPIKYIFNQLFLRILKYNVTNY